MDARTCPAAHSMDTTWFAIDADGYVGMFRTGEDGGLPTAAAMGPEGGDLDTWPLEAMSAARVIAAGNFPVRDWDPGPPTFAADALLVLVPEAAKDPTTYRHGAAPAYSIEAELGGGVTCVHDAEPRIVATRKALEPSELTRLEADPRVERLVLVDEILDWSFEAGGGMYSFINDDYGTPALYARSEVEAAPVKLDDLPSDLRERIASLRFPVRFEQHAELVLDDYLDRSEYETWSDPGDYDEPLEDDWYDGPDAAKPPPPRGTKRAPTAPRTEIPKWVLVVVAIVGATLLWWLLR